MELRPVAKINITLKVKGLREDGYHYIESLCLPVDLKDDLSVETINDNKDVLEVNDSSLADPAHNLVTRREYLLKQDLEGVPLIALMP